MDTFHSEFALRRKVLSSAFFKSKIKGITKLIKRDVLDEIKRIQHSAITEIDLAKFTLGLQSKIIMSISFGRIKHNENTHWENDDGTFCELPVCWAIHRNFKYSGT